jgi:peptide deformylase
MVSRPLSADEIRTPAFQNFCDDLFETMEDYDGLGLAAPQVHVPLRVVIATLDEERGPEFFVNPVVTPIGETTTTTWEGCLSVEGMRGRVERPDHVTIEALDRDGTPKHYELRGHPAVVIQHECDHLDGVLYIDRADTRTMAFIREYRRFGALGITADGDDEVAAAEAPAIASDLPNELADFDDDVYGELTAEELGLDRGAS